MPDNKHNGSFWILPILGLGVSAVFWWLNKTQSVTLAGMVTDSLLGLGIEDVTVVVDDKSTTSGINGFYRVTSLKVGTFHVYFEKIGYVSLVGQVTLAPGEKRLNVQMEPM